MRVPTIRNAVLTMIACAGVLTVLPARARAQAPKTEAAKPEKIEVENLKTRYWETAEEADLKVVQNRIYKKESKFELGLFAGTISTDPFLSVKSLGGSLGYHFTESWALNALAWKSFASSSSAQETLIKDTGRSANTNDPKSFVGAEAAYSPIYGKLSFLGSAILHYDLHLSLGLGNTSTQSGSYVTPFAGVGQQIYLSQGVALKLDYRLMRYSENVLEEVGTATIPRDAVALKRTNYSDVITLGISLFL